MPKNKLNAEIQSKNRQDLVKQQNDKINQIATQLQFLMEQVTDHNYYPPVATLSSSNRKDPYASGTKIDQIAAQM